MYETQWESLASITLKNQDSVEGTRCLCSRSFIRYREDKVIQCLVGSQNKFLSRNEDQQTLTRKNRSKSDTQHNLVDPYCSTSYANDFATDVHDSLPVSSEGNISQASESGADLTDSVKLDINVEWQKFWSINGEKLIWQSWITKYSAFISPEYLNSDTSLPNIHNNTNPELKNNQASKFAFETTEFTTYQKETAKYLERELSGNEEVSNDISEGWNPLSPLSIDCGTETEQLLAPHGGASAGSYTSSSIRTVDSMTNVTRMTVSSIDFNKSPSDSLSSVSSVDSSLSLTSSGKTDEDNENEWNTEWKKHYEEQYLLQYNKFVAEKDDIADLKMTEEESNSSEISEKEEEMDEETKQRLALGLPLSFGKKVGKRRILTKVKKSVENEDFNSKRNKLKAAFSLVRVEYSEKEGEVIVGDVDYKLKDIRLQNSMLKFHSKRAHSFSVLTDDSSEENPPCVASDCLDDKNSSDEDVTTTESVPTNTNEEKSEIPRASRRKRRKKIQYPAEIKENPKLKKFWHRRLSLFSRFDEGIKLDEESWYSVTPELIAKNTADRCKTDIIIDAFCGAGGNTIQFALTCKKVIAIDVDPKKIEIAKNNAEVYGVSSKVEFIIGDFLTLAPNLKADIVFLSPPWGGPSYAHQSSYDLEKMLQPVPFSQLMDASRLISRNVALFLPKNSNTYDVIKQAGENGFVEIEQNFLNKRLIAITVYYNDLIKKT
ncbi:hypothetical protein WA026_013077 [Henosepilachna vigintioctopunctata]|uniref:Trimethylguanosine synthase n=1 Tax=Henosepilachna vigintioctopunctata TaxID=420089 RepID=A0AAW1UMU0_9CUCU